MKPLFLISLFVLTSMSFGHRPTEYKQVGTMTLYVTSDGNYRLIYSGNYHPCIMKQFVDDAYSECDTLKVPKCEIEDLIDFMTRPKMDTCYKPKPIKCFKI